MQQKESKICFIAVLLHILLLRSFAFLSQVSKPLYLLLYLTAYFIPIFILTKSVKSTAVKAILSIYDIKAFFASFISMVLFSSLVSVVFADNSTAEVNLSVYTFILSGIIAPIAEELLWRNGVFRILSEYGFIPAALISSLLFSLMHSGTAGLCYAMFSGILFCLLYSRTNNPILPIILHILNNCLSLLSVKIQILIPLFLLVACLLYPILAMIARKQNSILKPDITAFNSGIFKNYYLYLTIIAFILIRFTEV